MVDILTLAKEAPKYEGSNWRQYNEAFFVLVDEKGYTKTAAVEFITKAAGLTSEESKKFKASAWHWKKKKGAK